MKTKALILILFIGPLLSVGAQAPLPKFLNEIQIPPLVVDPNDYDLDVIQTSHDFNPHDPADPLNGVTTFAFEDFNNPGTTSILGPTLKWSYKETISASVFNTLSERTTCHWHGAHVPQKYDGGPYQLIQPDTIWEANFQVLDKSATLWYHPHAMGLTYQQVQMGLAGLIIVEDSENDPNDPDDDLIASIHGILPNTYNVDDFPLVFQTKKFDPDANGQMQIRSGLPGFKSDYEFMVNAIIDPYMQVPANMIRLRLLNGDAKFSFNFSFENEDGSNFPAQLIATDAGYTDHSYTLEEVLMAPGERTEWLLDLRGIPEGTEIFIKNIVSNMPSGVIGNSSTTNGWANDRQLLKLIVGPQDNTINPSPLIGFPILLSPLETPAMSDVSKERTKVFRSGIFQDVDGKDLFSIDSSLMDMTIINDTVLVNATELWTLENATDIAHPWHIHDVHFWITEIIDAQGNLINPDDHPEMFSGPKDNVLVQPGWKLSYLTTFSDYSTTTEATNSYMYHCHILPHEDKGMMGTFVVWDGVSTSVKKEIDLSTNSMEVYPNPASDRLTIRGNSSKESILSFTNMNGQVLNEIALPSFDKEITINIDQLPAGMLLLGWQTNEGNAFKKIVINP